jgi:U3 small nucleolar RNA-associated protein 25
VRLRNFLKAADASFVANSEYADASEVGRARADFSAGEARIMLYSERAHFFRRHVIRGARRLTFYAPPERPDFYAELLMGLEPGQEAADVTLLFTRWDAPALERLVGSSRAQRMLKEVHTPSYVFC